jgi:TrmH family RNA methyltransferase
MVSKNELKFIKSLKVKKYRLRERRFIVEGTKNVLELINSKYKIDLLLVSEGFRLQYESYLNNLKFEIVSEKVLASIGSFKSNNTCLAVAYFLDDNDQKIDLNEQIFCLDGVSDPGNFGTIIRTLDWFGFKQIVCSDSCAELHNPKVISSSMGSFTRMKVVYTDLKEFVGKSNLPLYGADMNGENLYTSKIKSPSIVVMGSESHGISPEIKEKLNYGITIPQVGKAESLNVGIATGIIASYLRMS